MERFKKIDMELMARTDLSSNEKIVLMVMLDDCKFYTQERGYYSPSYEGLGDTLGMAYGTVRDTVRKLTLKGFIHVTKVRGAPNRYYVEQSDARAAEKAIAIKKAVESHTVTTLNEDEEF